MSKTEDMGVCPSNSQTDNGESSGNKLQPDSKIFTNDPSETIASFSSHEKEDKLPLIEKDVRDKHLERPPEDVMITSHVGTCLSIVNSKSEKNLETSCGDQRCELSENFQKLSPELVENKLVVVSSTVPDSLTGEQFKAPAEDLINFPGTNHLGPACEDGPENSNIHERGTPMKNSANSEQMDTKFSKSSKKKYKRTSVASSDRVLRTRSQEKPKVPEPSQLANDGLGRDESGTKRKNRKKKKMESRVADEYSRIGAQVRYFLNRINYEQSLIAAYSSDGWKGLSLDKLKPEKELQRATSEILRRKLKIRELFQRLDSLCAEGRLPESLFDSDGEIDSDDIFCAKCGSEELSLENDIILCDGFCDRGFHQFCLEPPLRKEDIPPGDEGWLCPACDCKADCLDLLNESLGTDLSITDTWEKVFPEATAGDNQDPNFGLPSDDSDDNDYEPDDPQSEEKDQEDESSSDDSDSSDFTSASDEMGTPPNDEQFLGLPSDDSEDDDYNPDAPDVNISTMQESSSSHSESDSEDENANAALIDNVSSGESSESNPDQCVPVSVSAKRSLERLDYKKLYDEEYGNASSHSSEDEDWTETGVPRKRQKNNGEAAVVSPNGNDLVSKSGTNAKENTSKRRSRAKKNLKDEDPVKSHENSPKQSSDGKKSTRRLGEHATQRLYQLFKENQYPDRSTKINLAKEVDLTFQQVDKWFVNARWSFNHTHKTNADLDKITSKNTSLPETKGKVGLGVGQSNASQNGAKNENGPIKAVTKSASINANDSVLANQDKTVQESTRRSTRSRSKGKMVDQALNPNLENDVNPANLPKGKDVPSSSRKPRKRKK